MFCKKTLNNKSKLYCCDNSSVSVFKIIALKPLKNNKKFNNETKSIIKSTSNKFKNKKYKLNKKNLVNSLCVQSVSNKVRFNGSKIRFDKNSAVFLDKNNKFFGTRINGHILKEVVYYYENRLDTNIIIFSKNKI